MSKYSRKKVVSPTAPTDEFVGFWQRASQTVAPYAGKLLIVVGAGLVVWLAVWGGGLLQGGAEKATEMLTQAVKIYQADLLGEKEAPPAADEDTTPRYKTAKERATATLGALDRLDKEHGGSDAAQRGVLVRAGVLFDDGRLDDADAAYRRFLESKPADPALQALAREGLGLSAEGRGKLDAALAVYKEHTGEFYRDQMQADQARVLLKKGDKKQAVDLYKGILARSPQSSMRDDITNRLATLED